MRGESFLVTGTYTRTPTSNVKKDYLINSILWGVCVCKSKPAAHFCYTYIYT